jgi:hypothetical protein
MDGWAIGVAANGVIAVAYLAVALLLGVNISRTRQWLRNPLAAGTCFLYVTCGGAHGIVGLELAGLAASASATEGARLLYGSWTLWGWDLVTAAVGVYYWTMRNRFPGLVTGTAVFEDLRQRQKRAVEINDNVVQGLVRAKLSLDLRRDEEGRAALHETVEASQRIVAELEATQKEAGA